MAANTLMLAAAALAMGASATGIAKTPGFIRYPDLNGQPFTVTYDNRSAFLTQNGVSERTLLLSGCIHYPRATPAQWQDLFQKAVNDGMNQVQTYVFWYGLQPKSDSESCCCSSGRSAALSRASCSTTLPLRCFVARRPMGRGLQFQLDAVPGDCQTVWPVCEPAYWSLYLR